jgi:hypothetical protein
VPAVVVLAGAVGRDRGTAAAVHVVHTVHVVPAVLCRGLAGAPDLQ